MPKIAYQDTKFSAEAARIINISNQFIADYVRQGFKLTLRQLYYRIVAGDHFPDDRTWVQTSSKKWVRDPQGTKNAEPNYTWLGKIISEARLAGHIDWLAIEDRTRELALNSHWGTPSDIISSAASSYHTDLWIDQRFRPEVWVEKDALSGVLEAACKPLDVPYFACRGYTSQTAMWEAGQRLLGYIKEGQTPVIFHLGDHDPSGIDMSRDIEERIEMFTGQSLDFRRIALTMDQVEESGAPPNPAKMTDSRFKSYMEQYGDESWELDALEPAQLVTLIQSHLGTVTDTKKFKAQVAKMEEERKELKHISENYDSVISSTSAVDFDKEFEEALQMVAEREETGHEANVRRMKKKKKTKKKRGRK